jgi:hypothetical protein
LEILSNLPFHGENKDLGKAFMHFPAVHLRVAQEFGDGPQKRQANYREPAEPLTGVVFRSPEQKGLAANRRQALPSR